jgi:hypothetical protein
VEPLFPVLVGEERKPFHQSYVSVVVSVAAAAVAAAVQVQEMREGWTTHV